MTKKIYPFIFIFFINNIVFALEKPILSYSQTGRADIRHDQDLYIHRIELEFNPFKETLNLNFIPFFEARRNLTESAWVRKELGFEVGKKITDWLYWLEAFQYIWSFSNENIPELESRLLLKNKIFKFFSRELQGFILNEYTYNLEDGRGIRNEVSVGVEYLLFKHFSINLDWRHIDLVHEEDSDTVEGGFRLSF